MLGQGQCPHLAWIVHASMFVSLAGMSAVLALCTGNGRGALQKLALSSVLWAPPLAMALRCHFTGATSELSLYIYWLTVVTLSGLPWLVMATNSVFRRALDSGAKDALAGAAYLSLAFNTCVPPLSVALRLYCTGGPLLAPDATWHSSRAIRIAAIAGAGAYIVCVASRGLWPRALFRTGLPYTVGLAMIGTGAVVWPARDVAWQAATGGGLLFGGAFVIISTLVWRRSGPSAGRHRATASAVAIQLIAGGVAIVLFCPHWPAAVGAVTAGAGVALGVGLAEAAVLASPRPHKVGCITAICLISAGVAVVRLQPWAHGRSSTDGFVGYGALGGGLAIGIIATTRSRHASDASRCRQCSLLLSAAAVCAGTILLGTRRLPELPSEGLIVGGALVLLVSTLCKAALPQQHHGMRSGGARHAGADADARAPLLMESLAAEREDLDRQRQEFAQQRMLFNLCRTAVPGTAAGSNEAPSIFSAFEWQDEYGQWNAYLQPDNAKIAAAAARGEGTVQLRVDANNTDYEVDLGRMLQRNTSTNVTRQIRLQQAVAAPGAVLPSAPPLPQAPAHWSNSGQLFVALDRDSAEYADVEARFHATCPRSRYSIEQVERVEHRDRWLAFESKRRILDNGLQHGANERVVWHGARADRMKDIVARGFNRDYSVRSLYGRGTYFARDAEYSTNPTYAVPSDGKQFLLLVHILAGEPCVGTEQMKQPLQKPRGRHGQLHESMVDNLTNPTIYVLSAGTDDHAYATHRVRFTGPDSL